VSSHNLAHKVHKAKLVPLAQKVLLAHKDLRAIRAIQVYKAHKDLREKMVQMVQQDHKDHKVNLALLISF
jgi:hypothetical protein